MCIVPGSSALSPGSQWPRNGQAKTGNTKGEVGVGVPCVVPLYIDLISASAVGGSLANYPFKSYNNMC